MRKEVCPDQSELKDLLLGRRTGDKRDELEEHYLNCKECAANTESIAITDDLTQALSNKSRLSGNEMALQSAITQAKTLAVLPDTVPDLKPTASDVTCNVQQNSGCNGEQHFHFLAPPQQEDEIGRFANYRVLEVLGSGGMGIVFRAEDILLKRLVALKVMKSGIGGESESKSRFIREAQATAALCHDHIVQIYQVGEERGTPFIAMQFLAGQSLQAVLDKSSKLSQIDVVRIGAEVASGLSLAHEKSLIHRDIKPDNIWIEAKSNRAKILDFGLARDLSTETDLTQSGVLLGTPSYMAPEQISGQEIDARCDLFSFGCVLYYLACGQRAFASPNIAGLLVAISSKPAVPIEQRVSGLHPQLAELIMKLLEKDPRQRPADAATVAFQLRQILVDLSAKQRPEQAITSQSTPSLQAFNGSNPPRRRWPLIACGGAALFAMLLGTIVITIRDRNGKETTIRVPSGSSTNVDAQYGSEVFIREEPTDGVKASSVAPGITANRADSGETTKLNSGNDSDKYPPLEKWLVGRKRLTVARNGSAQFTTIQEAIDALQAGEVVQILDKGPYRESLRWEGKKDCGLIANPGTVVELNKWSTDTPEDKVFKGHRFSWLKDVRIHGIDFLCTNDFLDMRSLIVCVGVDGLCMEECVVAAVDLRMKGIVQGLVVYSDGWAKDGADPAEFTGNCVRNCVFATNRISLLLGGGTTYLWRNLMIFGPNNDDDIYASNLSTYQSKVLHTLMFSDNVMIHQGGAAQIFFHGDAETASRVVIRNNTFHGKTAHLAVIQESAIAQQFEFVNNLGVNCSNLVHSDPEFLKSAKLHSSGNRSLTSEVSGVSQRSLFTPMPWKILSLSPLDRNALRIDVQSLGNDDANHASGALPFGPVTDQGDWFTEQQDRLKAALHHQPEEARKLWMRPLVASPK